MYESHEDIFYTVRDGLLGPCGYDYEPGGVANLCDRDRDVPKTT